MAQWWERSPPTAVARVFLRVIRFPSLHKNQHSKIPIRSGKLCCLVSSSLNKVYFFSLSFFLSLFLSFFLSFFLYYLFIYLFIYLRTPEKCRKHMPQASVFYISLVFSNVSNVRSVLSRCNTRLRLLHLLYDIDFTRATIKHAFFYVLYMDYWPSVRSRWLDIGQVPFFCVFMDRDEDEVHKLAKKERGQ